VLFVLGPPLALWLWWIWQRCQAEEPPAPPPAEIDITPEVSAMPVEPDDLARVEGIGPKIAAVLRSAGVTTFARLAATGEERLREILREAGIGANPGTWPEQARLAAAGRWETLAALQDELKGGLRV
jgi:predicted flap endonuclease-1-like 5' DNA nuclease